MPDREPPPTADLPLDCRELLDALPTAVVVIDCRSQHVEVWNRGAEELFGVPAGQAIGQPLSRFLPGPPPASGEIRAALRPGGAKAAVELTCQRLAHGDGRGERWLIHIQDVSARELIASQLRLRGQASERNPYFSPALRQAAAQADLMETLLMRLPAGVFYLGADLRFRFVNPYYAGLLGRPPEAINGRHFFELLPGTESATEQLLAEAAGMLDGQGVSRTAVAWKIGPKETYWDLTITAVERPDGELDGYLVLCEEVSAHVKLEAELERHVGLLNEAQRLAQIGSWEVELPSGQVTCSDELFRIFGIPPSQAPQRLEDYLPFVHPAERDDAEQKIEDALRSGLPFNLTRRIIRPSGEVRDLSVWGTPLTDPAGRVTRVIGAMQDITEQRQVERLKEAFLATASHELRTPLTAIKGPLYLLESGSVPLDSPDARSLIALARRNVDRMARLVGDILDTQRLAAGRLTVHPAPTPVRELLAEAVDTMQAQAREAGVPLQLQAEPGVVLADAGRIVQVLTNMIDNAIAFSPRGQPVEVSAIRRGQEMCFAVADHGPGIPEAQLERIFERFSQVDSSLTRPKGGTGLGLTISRGIVEQHGGRIWAENLPGGGAQVSFTLRLAP